MKDGMYGAHSVWEFKGNRMSTRKGNDGERTKILFGELLRGSCRAEVLGLDIDLISDLEVRSWKMRGICRTLVTLLRSGHLGAEESVEFQGLDGIGTRAFGGDTGVRC